MEALASHIGNIDALDRSVMPENSIKVLVADDSGFMRLLISDILRKATGITVQDTAENGKEALEKVKSLRPDVVLLDMLMPDYDGLYAVRRIMQECPTPIVILSSLGNSNINPIMECLQLGAFDYLNKPNRNNARLRDIDAAIVNKVKLASAVDLKKLTDAKRSFNLNPHTFAEQLPYDIIAIGSSTGGPSALEQIISKLPSNLALPVIIVQHMPENFVPSFALRLDALTPLEVRVGARNMVIEPGKIIVAPGDRNMIVKKQNGTAKVDFTRRSFREYNNPSVTGLMNSVAEVYKGKAIGVILTGMGKDGVEGMQAIKKAGGVTIAQNRETSVVFGMPGEAIARGCIDHVVPIHDMGGFLISCLS